MQQPTENELHRVAVTGIIWRLEGGVRKYLITKRSPNKKRFPNKWTVPGGGLETRDYINDVPTHEELDGPQWVNVVERGLRREIREEAGVEVSGIEYLLDIAFIQPDGYPCLVLSMYCKYESGEVALDADATEYAWITAAEVDRYDLIKGIDNEIRQVEARLSKN